MRFYDNQEQDKILGRYKVNGTNYKKYYLDGSRAEYSSFEDNHEEELKKIMLEQSIKRDKELYKTYKDKLKKDTLELSLILLGLAITSEDNLMFLYCILFILLLIKAKMSIDNLIKYKELNKYHNYLIIKEDLEKEENSNILDIIEFEKIYQIPININTLDDYSDRDIKILKKEIERRKNV